MTTSFDYLKILASKVTDELIVIWGPLVANEWHELRDTEGTLYDVYMSGAAPFALGIAMGLPQRRVICLDGDGSMLMDLPILPAIAFQNPSNLIVVVFDNMAYEACARIPTFTAHTADLVKIAQGSGIKNAWSVKTVSEFEEALTAAYRARGTSFINLKVEFSTRRSPPRAADCMENKYRFIRHIEKTEKVRIIHPLGVSLK